MMFQVEKTVCVRIIWLIITIPNLSLQWQGTFLPPLPSLHALISPSHIMGKNCGTQASLQTFKTVMTVFPWRRYEASGKLEI